MAVAPTQETTSVEQAKRLLREAAAEFDPYALVRARPLSCAGGAFLLGLGWKWLRPGRAVPTLAALSLQVAGRALVQNLTARLKSGLTRERSAQERLAQERLAQERSAQERPGRAADGAADRSGAGSETGGQSGPAASGTSACTWGSTGSSS